MVLLKKEWKPILKISSIKKQLELIAEVIEKSTEHDKGFSLASGDSGIALFFYYYWLYTGKNKYLNIGNNLILKNSAFLTHPVTTHSLCNGIAGFMWTVNHLIENNFINGNCNELFSEKDSSLYSSMEKDINEGKYDFLHNALGIGLYFLNRNNEQSLKYIEDLILVLEKIAEKDSNGLKWISSIETENKLKKKVYNISMSHGMASIIVFLSKTYKQNLAKEKNQKLLCGAITYLLSKKFDIPTNNKGSFFPSYVLADGGKNDNGSRLAWCYGDLGIGIALWQASQVLQNKDWENIAIDILVQTTTRKDPFKERVIDSGICHGSAGIAHIYNRMYQRTEITAFKESSIYWLNDTLNKAVFTDGLAGYKAWRPKEQGGWIKEIGLLEGIAGIGLVLLSTISNIEPKWDECLLLS